MTSRREFLQIGIAATAWPLASRAALGATPTAAGAVSRASSVPLFNAIYDTRFPESVAFGRQMEAHGIATQAIEADVTEFWYTELDPHWRKTPLAIAGLTAHGPLFCLEQLAWQHGMRVVFRAEHHYGSNGVMRHVVNGPETMVRDSAGLSDASDWGARMAKAATRCPTGRSAMTTAALSGPMQGPAHAEDDPLISWVIAPAAKA